MNFRLVLRLVGVAAATVALAGCGAKALKHYQPDAFGASIYARHYLSTPGEACEAARRALLSQGYVVTEAKTTFVSAHKLFQPDPAHHIQMEFRVTCAGDGPGESVAFASATEDQYVAKSGSSSASVGVGILGSLSVPLEGGADSLVKVASKTVTNDEVYDRLFSLISGYLVTVEREAGKPATKESIEAKPHAAGAADQHEKKAVATPASALGADAAAAAAHDQSVATPAAAPAPASAAPAKPVAATPAAASEHNAPAPAAAPAPTTTPAPAASQGGTGSPAAPSTPLEPAATAPAQATPPTTAVQTTPGVESGAASGASDPATPALTDTPAH